MLHRRYHTVCHKGENLYSFYNSSELSLDDKCYKWLCVLLLLLVNNTNVPFVLYSNIQVQCTSYTFTSLSLPPTSGL